MRTQPFNFRKVDLPGSMHPHEAIEIRTRKGRAILTISAGQGDDVDVVRNGDRLYVIARSARMGYAGVQAFDLRILGDKIAPLTDPRVSAGTRPFDTIEKPAPVYHEAAVSDLFWQSEVEDAIGKGAFDVSPFTFLRRAAASGYDL